MSEAPNVEERAREMGWAPKDEFKGGADKWVDAETFVKRGDEVLPILRKTNEGLRSELTSVRGEVNGLRTALAESQEAINSFKEFHQEEVKERVKAARDKLKGELVAAKQAGDHAAEVELTDELGRLNAAEAAPKPQVEKKTATTGGNFDPVFQAWANENQWYGQDPIRTSLMQGVAIDLRTKGDTTTGRAFIDKCVSEVDKKLSPRPRDSKVASGGGGGGGTEASGGAGGFSDLPKEAQDTCRRQAARMVGPNKAFKDERSWQDYYTKQFNEAE